MTLAWLTLNLRMAIRMKACGFPFVSKGQCDQLLVHCFGRCWHEGLQGLHPGGSWSFGGWSCLGFLSTQVEDLLKGRGARVLWGMVGRGLDRQFQFHAIPAVPWFHLWFTATRRRWKQAYNGSVKLWAWALMARTQPSPWLQLCSL